MPYKNKFESQWNNLRADFAAKIEKTPVELLSPKELNSWLQARTHRWSSVVEMEGLILDQEDNPELSSELRSALGSVSVEQVNAGKAPSPILHIGVGAVIAAVFAVVSKVLLDRGTMMAVVLAVLTVAAAICEYTIFSSSKKKELEKALRSGYVKQLDEYKRELLSICDKYEK